MYAVFIFVLLAIVVEAHSTTYMRVARQSPNYDFLRTREEPIRRLDILRKDQVRSLIRATHVLRTIPNRLHQMRIQYYIKEDGYSHRALDTLCEKCLRDMWDQRKTSMTCISISERTVRTELFNLFQTLFDLEYGSKEKQCEHQKELRNCRNPDCVDSVVYRSEEETRQIYNDTMGIERMANSLIEKMTVDSNVCMKGYIQSFENSTSSCDDNPEQVDDPNRYGSHPNHFYPHNDSKMET